MEALDNLVKTNQLKIEPFDEVEFAGMLRAGDNKLNDASLKELSEDSQFMLAYGPAFWINDTMRVTWQNMKGN